MQNKRPQNVVQYLSTACNSSMKLFQSREERKLTASYNDKENQRAITRMFRNMLHNSDHNPSFVRFDFCRRTRKRFEHLLIQIPVIPSQSFSGKYHVHIKKHVHVHVCLY